MKAIILCAGQGTRLRPYTTTLPKCMVKVDGVSLIERQLEVLKSRGVDEIILIGGHFHHKLPASISKIVNPEYRSSNMVKSLSMALHHISGNVIISYGDIVYSAATLDLLTSAQHNICVAIDSCWEEYWKSRSSDYMSDVESLVTGDDGSIIDIGNKPRSRDCVEGQYMGLTRLSGAGCLEIKKFLSNPNQLVNGKDFNDCYMTDMLQALIMKGIKVWPCFTSSPWIEVDTAEDLNNKVTLDRVRAIFDSLD